MRDFLLRQVADGGETRKDSFKNNINHRLATSKRDNHLKVLRSNTNGLNPGEILPKSLIV